ncbi:Diacylglycerol kinase delta [Hypsibius exemplaris]|uniref:Diacylglycerol kinase n=1 Tax=Hypsibius exemplaris TaxID=2072580 RepID=A0A1W0WZ77_HYPEX|nr:Diacylglycerol kinase delta [Hypsibius exemplaris]
MNTMIANKYLVKLKLTAFLAVVLDHAQQVISPYRNLILCAETRRDMEEWIAALKANASREYYDVAEQLDLFSGQHNWYVCSHARPTYCNICKEVLSGVASNGLSCEVCKFKAHKRCAIRAPNSCKWTTLASMGQENILEDSDGTIHMRHQWLEGNLTVSAKCSASAIKPAAASFASRIGVVCGAAMVHTNCLPHFPERCSLQPACRFSTVPPTLFNHAENDVLCISDPQGLSNGSRRYAPSGLSPLLVFANSKSGDNQGVKFLRRFKQTLNPAQVFDLMHSGTTLGLQLFKKFDSFRVLVCGGDGSIGWVLQDLDAHNLLRKCQVGILPLGTGNDLARVLGWGSSCDADTPLAHVLEKYEWASSKLLDRWSIMEYHDTPGGNGGGGGGGGGSGTPDIFRTPSPGTIKPARLEPIAGYEDSVASHLTRIILSEEQGDVHSSALILCQTIKDFVAKVGVAFEHDDRDQESMTQKCQNLNQKLDRLLETLHEESRVVGASSAASAALATTSQTSLVSARSALKEMEPSRSGSATGHHFPAASSADHRRAFIQQEVILSRANSLKKAVRQIIEDTEKAVDEQNCLRVPRALARRQSRSAENVLQRLIPDSVPGPSAPSFPKRPPSAADFLNLASVASVRDTASSDLGRSRSTTVTGSHPWLTSPPSRQAVPHVKKNLVTNLASGTNLITRVLLANADAMCQFGMSSLMRSNEDVALEAFNERCVMSNYFGIGLDAKIALEFHQKREEHPEKCRSRTKNMMWYGVLGVKELQKQTYQHLEQRVQLECDGQRIPLPSLQGIVVLNISSYMGGANFWGGTKPDDFFRAPAFDDRMLEVVAVFGTMQMAVSKVVRIQHHRIAQCRSVKITIKGEDGVPVQVDGEAWRQPPGTIHIVHKNKAQMLCRDRQFENVFRTWQHQQQPFCQSNAKSTGDLKGPAILSEKELEVLGHFCKTSARLIRCVKVATLTLPEIEAEISHIVSKASESLDHLCPYGRLMNMPSVKFIASRLLNCIRELRDNGADLLRAKPEALVLSAEVAEDLQCALNEVDLDLQKVMDAGLAVMCGEEEPFRDASLETRTLKSRFLDRFRRNRTSEPSDTPFKYPSLSVREWASEDVAVWLASLQLGEYKEVFISHDIRGSELIHLERRDLKDLGITKVGHLKRIQQAIRDLILSMGDNSVP